MAPVRVARMTSPEPIYSAAQTNDGPTRAKTARPTGGFLISVLSIKLFLTAICADCTHFLGLRAKLFAVKLGLKLGLFGLDGF